MLSDPKELPKDELELLTIIQLSSMLQTKESHIRKMIFNKEIPFIKIGRLIRFKKDTIKQWLKKQSTSVQE